MKRTRASARVPALAGYWVLLGAVACSTAGSPAAGNPTAAEDSGTHATPEASAAGTFPWTEPCGSCMRDHCGDAAATCHDDTSCASFAGCLAACRADEADCYYACFERHPKTRDLGEYAACVTESCALACAPCGGLRPGRGPGCDACTAQLACDQATACLLDSECVAYFGCTARECTNWVEDPGCRASCFAAHPARVLKQNFLSAGAGCTAECGLGSQWQCIGPDGPAYRVPQPTKQMVDVSVYVWSYGASGPLEGAVVKVCRAFAGCEEPGVITGKDGIATLSFEQRGGEHFETTHPDAMGPQFDYPGITFVTNPGTVTLLYGAGSLLMPSDGGVMTEGTVEAVLADCAGSPISAGQTATLDCIERPGAAMLSYPAVYGSPLLAIPPATSGAYAYFRHLPPGTCTLRALDPSGRLVGTMTNVEVVAGGISVVYVNAPNPAQ